MKKHYPIDKELLIEYYNDLPDNLPDLANPKLYDKLADFLNENTQGLTWNETIDTLKFILIYTIGVSIDEYAKDVDKKERMKWK